MLKIKAITTRAGTRTAIWATDLAVYAFCPEAERLRALGAAKNQRAEAQMAQGVQEHAAWQRREDARSAAASASGGRRLRTTALVLLGIVFAIVALAMVLLGGGA